MSAQPAQGTESSIALSLLSLSLAASNAAPLSAAASAPTAPGLANTPARASTTTVGNGVTTPVHPSMKHRRLSSTGQTKRRMSDARDAASRPSLSLMQNMASPPLAPRVTHSFASPSKASTAAVTIPAKTSGKSGTLVPSPDDDELPTGAVDAKPASGKGSGKKRQTTFTCESCSKVYRHPSCLIKHRWEHSPHWREASKFVLSKHQQVQLLEAAAILSHMSTSPSGSSLPEDRSLWPSFLSGGMLPPPVPTTPSGATPTEVGLTSSSMPSTTTGHFPARAPRMHDYALPPDVGSQGSITQLRPGLLGVPTGSSRGASPALDVRDHYRRTVESEGVDGWAAPYSSSVPVTAASLRSSAVPELLTPSQSYASTAGTGGWSLPRSDLRSSSGGSSGARSRSGSMEREEVDIEGEGYYNAWRRAEPVKEEDEDGIQGDWAGMDMDMD